MNLIIRIFFQDTCYHGEANNGHNEWPPSPFRLFQALVAGAGLAHALTPPIGEALRWLERQPPPTIAAPVPIATTQPWTLYVLNNSRDKYPVHKLRGAQKHMHPVWFAPNIPVIYRWIVTPEDTAFAQSIHTLTSLLYQLGRGVDLAWATSDWVEDHVGQAILDQYPGRIWQPTNTTDHENGIDLRVPQPGSWNSLHQRHTAWATRWSDTPSDRTQPPHGVQALPPASFRTVYYDTRPLQWLYALWDRRTDAWAPWPLAAMSQLTQQIHHSLITRCLPVFPIETIYTLLHHLILQPLPSIGHPDADLHIRRVLITIPPTLSNLEIALDDLRWALDGLVIEDHTILIRTTDSSFLQQHYAHPAAVWETVTPILIPQHSQSSRAAGLPHLDHLAASATAVTEALRAAGIREPITHLQLQHAPWRRHGLSTRAFQNCPRGREAWHATVTFARPIEGPIAIGIGRQYGWGLLAPRQTPPDIAVSNPIVTTAHVPTSGNPTAPEPGTPTIARLQLTGSQRPSLTDAVLIGDVVRRALMAQVGRLGHPIPPSLTGRDTSGHVRTDDHRHAFFLPEDADNDGWLDHVMIYIPDGLDRTLIQALNRLTMLYPSDGGHEWPVILDRIGSPDLFTSHSRMVAQTRIWQSVTPYLHPWHTKRHGRFGPSEQLRRELALRGFPDPLEVVALPAVVVRQKRFTLPDYRRIRADRTKTLPDPIGSFWRIIFPHPVQGPVALGYACHYGLGLFAAQADGERVSR
ncbi:MAG: hypothetical protein C7B47_15640 [Sulfobacillus thermosulfidooxidans]|uniref:Type I-U CRISPR-associated protein Cas5/Cas6 n=1 Tax=Sulfobacillus thermosulfidooxidans TaxID=28034 RepID=A0A2T2WNA5_SULTH|nr:MAG: hypothetical protein C7B47_15640 [Sulfobacillus thermosulfidooxidans]